jgi:hypothetical protein
MKNGGVPFVCFFYIGCKMAKNPKHIDLEA